jgi:hypothetical protein
MSPDGFNAVQQTVAQMNYQKNYQNAVVMDAEDDFDHKQLSFAGLADAQAEIRMQVASDMNMPVIKLFGQSQSTGGLGTSSTEEMENYNLMIESDVRGKIKYHILRMAELRCQNLFGHIPEDLEGEFKPLRELPPVDQETVKTQKWTRIKEAKAMGGLTELEFRDACNKGNIFDIQLDTTEAALNELDEEVQENAENQAALEGGGPDDQNGGPNKEDGFKEKKQNALIAKIKPYSRIQKLRNSPDFDRASFEADGGEDWIDSRREHIFSNPQNVDWKLWNAAKIACKAVYGEFKWKFVLWWYRKNGGAFL